MFRFLKTPQNRQMQMILVKPPEERLEDLYFCQCVIKNLCLRSKFRPGDTTTENLMKQLHLGCVSQTERTLNSSTRHILCLRSELQDLIGSCTTHLAGRDLHPIQPSEAFPLRGAMATVSGTQWCDIFKFYYSFLYHYSL